MPAKWFMIDFEEWACHEAYHIQTLSDVPSHQWLRWTINPPWKHPRSRRFRGLEIFGDVYYCFTGHISIEQNEPGDTLIHTFDVAPWPRYEIRYFYMIGFINMERSPSHSPIFARSIDYTYYYLASSVTHATDLAILWNDVVYSCPGFCPGPVYTGRFNNPAYRWGGALRFRDCWLPRCAEILYCYLTLQAAGNQSSVPVHSRISVENVDNADNFFAITDAAFWARWAVRIGIVNWSNLPPFVNGQLYDTPSLIVPIQTLVSRPGWRAGNALVLFWEDFEQRTPFGVLQFRIAVGYSAGIVIDPVLHVWYNHWQVIGEAIY